MKHRHTLLIGLLGISLAVAQGPPRRPAPTILKGPADWRPETMPIPPGFAPDIKLNGFEEARFAPGMFDTSSPNYFTYILVISANGAPELDKAGIQDFLQKYYRGLSTGVGRRKGLTPDPAQMTAEVASTDAKDRYTAKVTYFDTFNDGRKIVLNVEAHVIPRPDSKKTYLTLLISPQPEDSAAWRTLREIEGNLQI